MKAVITIENLKDDIKLARYLQKYNYYPYDIISIGDGHNMTIQIDLDKAGHKTKDNRLFRFLKYHNILFYCE